MTDIGIELTENARGFFFFFLSFFFGIILFDLTKIYFPFAIDPEMQNLIEKSLHSGHASYKILLVWFTDNTSIRYYFLLLPLAAA